MQVSTEMIEKYKREMQQMFAKSNKNGNTTNVATAPSKPKELPKAQTLDDFPQFENNGDELTRRIEEILKQNGDVALDSDRPNNLPRSPIMQNQNESQITPIQMETKNPEPSYEDEAGAIESEDNTTQTRQQMASRTCIRGGQMAKYSPPANTGSSIGGGESTSSPLTDSADLIVEVFAANRAIPIENAQIRIKNPDDNSILAILQTDEDGRTTEIKLSAPDRNLSLQPQNVTPFVNYFADIRAEGYVPQSDIKIQLFGGQKSLLPANLIPREEI